MPQEEKLQFLEPNRAEPRKPTPLEEVQKAKAVIQQPFPGVQHWFNLQGFMRTTTTTPTAAPKTLADALVIYVDSLSSPTTKRLYIYSVEADSWFYVALT